MIGRRTHTKRIRNQTAKTRIPSASLPNTGIHRLPYAWLLNHARALFFSLGKLYRTPVASLMTIAVIGIALALPAGLYVMLGNIKQITSNWNHGVQITLYLKPHVSNRSMDKLADQLRKNRQIAQVKTISPAQGLSELAKTGGFGGALDALPQNPLPPVIIVTPHLQGHHASQIRTLRQSLAQYPKVAQAQLNLAWVKRLYAIVATAQRALWVIGGILALAVLLIVGNTIRLDIFNRRQEIEVAKLIGATNAFIRRPFLYGGFWLGLFGGFLALTILTLSLWLLAGPVNYLAGLYGSNYTLSDLSISTTIKLLAFGILLGLCGSWFAVTRHLRNIEPS